MRRLFNLLVFAGTVTAAACGGSKSPQQSLTGEFSHVDTVGNSIVSDSLVIKQATSKPGGIYHVELYSIVRSLRPGISDRVTSRNWNGIYDKDMNAIKVEPSGTLFIYSNEGNTVKFIKTEFHRKK
ncbi:hypothetical protein [Chitinophaga arvensicola]|uniref:Lipoprotein n=1 Tax=Chitinophaga arvensicola TaxID=29529 RepID=A0A1I0PNR8_9BACT|nr:hypothetical protein [Chitinophaga arvensicola]SEW15983.1 hypothetical protein SAMN04488122_0886 [Chitinophaga arvensicola]